MRAHLRGILDELCHTIGLLYALVVIEVILLLFSIAGMIYLGRGSAGFVIWVLNALGIVVLLSFTAAVVIACFRR